MHLFDAMVAPILLYGAEVWGYEKNDISETLHLEFCKYIMKVKECTPNYIVYELGGVPSYKCKDDWFLGTYCKWKKRENF